MALINCPECGKEVSDQAPACIHCGFPLNNTNNINLQQYISNIESQLNRIGDSFINNYGETPIYISIKEDMNFINSNISTPNEIYDKIPSIILITLHKYHSHISWKTCKRYFELVKFNYMTERGFQEFADLLKTRITIKNGQIVYWYPIYQFLNFAPENCKNDILELLQSNDAFGNKKIDYINSFAPSHINDDVTIIKETPPIKCPTCGSTNISKISTAKKAVGFATVGVFSSNFGKTMECKNCGYKW